MNNEHPELSATSSPLNHQANDLRHQTQAVDKSKYAEFDLLTLQMVHTCLMRITWAESHEKWCSIYNEIHMGISRCSRFEYGGKRRYDISKEQQAFSAGLIFASKADDSARILLLALLVCSENRPFLYLHGHYGRPMILPQLAKYEPSIFSCLQTAAKTIRSNAMELILLQWEGGNFDAVELDLLDRFECRLTGTAKLQRMVPKLRTLLLELSRAS